MTLWMNASRPERTGSARVVGLVMGTPRIRQSCSARSHSTAVNSRPLSAVRRRSVIASISRAWRSPIWGSPGRKRTGLSSGFIPSGIPPRRCERRVRPWLTRLPVSPAAHGGPTIAELVLSLTDINRAVDEIMWQAIEDLGPRRYRLERSTRGEVIAGVLARVHTNGHTLEPDGPNGSNAR